MSAPDTNIEKQTRRHKPVLIGVAAVVALVVVFIFAAQTAPDDDATAIAPTVAESE